MEKRRRKTVRVVKIKKEISRRGDTAHARDREKDRGKITAVKGKRGRDESVRYRQNLQ